MLIGIAIAVLQQITGINAVFFYAPAIFEQSGIGTDASFLQAVLVGLVNLVFTVVAILLIDRIGRRPLLALGFGGIAACMLLLAWTFSTATYSIDPGALDGLPAEIDHALAPLVGRSFDSDVSFRQSVVAAIGDEAFRGHQPAIVSATINVNARVVLFALLGFVASFAVSVGPIMWVLFSELFPNRLRGLAGSFVGFINSAVSFTVQLMFPWELDTLGNAATFLIYALFAIAGLLFVLRFMPETRGKNLETVAAELVSAEGRLSFR
jgi:MFS family permease